MSGIPSSSSSTIKHTKDDDELIVNYHDACVHGRDLKILLKKNCWLNDALIHYQFCRLQQRQPSAVLLLDPAVASFFMHQCIDREELDEFCSGYNNFVNLSAILVPINDTLATSDSSWAVPGKGTHWSLLKISIIDEKDETNKRRLWNHHLKAYHMDSVPDSGNAVAARAFVDKFHSALSNRDTSCSQNENVTSTNIVQCKNVPRQANGYDCGVHVLIMTEVALEHDPDDDDFEKQLDARLGPNPATSCAQMRQCLAQDILSQEAGSNESNKSAE